MNILFVIAEMAPLVKVGGVGDVGGSLPIALKRLGHDVRVALPFYRSIDRSIAEKRLGEAEGAIVWRGDHEGLPLYLMEHEAFERDEVYGYEDDVARFLSFCDSLLANAEALDWTPDIVHMHDWHTGLLASRLTDGAIWRDAATIFTIHNLGYRGDFDQAFAKAHGLAASLFASPVVPDRTRSGLAQGIMHSNVVSTVSPTYAREIVGPKLGDSMAPLLLARSESLEGILNGIDTTAYDPGIDPHLAVSYSADSLQKRIANKAVLQQTMGLPASGTPLIGVVTRLFEQKAPDIAAAAIEKLIAEAEFQFVVLGTGAPEYEREMSELAARHPARVAVRLAFDYGLGQQIYGGSDMFLMPSRYEPCGLGQMIAMRYGSVPVVRRTGGLADSVTPYNAASNAGTGFLFDDLTVDALAGAIRDAFEVYADGESWRALQQRGMRSDFSWDNAARQYVDLYERATAMRGGK